MSKQISGKSRKELAKMKPNWLTVFEVFLALGWLFITFLQENPEIYLLFGGLNLITMVLLRYIIRQKQALEMEGGIAGYLVLWVITSFFYQNKTEYIALPVLETSVQVNDMMILFLTLSFLAWFIIAPRKTTQDILWNLPPFYSNLLLNLWKLAVLSLLLVGFIPQLNPFSNLAIIFYLIVGFFELIITYNKQIRIDYIDIILNPVQLLLNIISGPVGALKWVLLTLIFIILDSLQLDLGTIALLFCALFIGIISLITSISRLILNSGLIESRVEEGKTIIPQVIEEVQLLSSSDKLIQFNEYYEVPEQILVNKRNQVVTMNKGDMILRIPFSKELETKTGVFFFHLNMLKMTLNIKNIKKFTTQKFTKVNVKDIDSKEFEDKIQSSIENFDSKEFEEKVKSSVKNFDLRGSSIHRISNEKWKDIEKKIIRLEKEKFTQKLGFKDSVEFDKELTKIIRRTVMAQEQVRSRLRGVPAPAFSDQTSYTSIIKANGINFPLDFIKDQEILEGQEIELIPGKDEYLFYIKRKKQE